jgi:esterase/lipase superfamily enzyme
MRARRLSLLLVFLMVLGGCQRVLMDTPIVATGGLIDPLKYVTPDRETSRVSVFVASARTVSGEEEPARFYTTDRSEEVRLGVATVDIGAEMTWEELRAASMTDKRERQPTLRLVDYEEYGPLWSTVWPPDYRFTRDWDAAGIDREPANRFVEAIDAELATSRRKHITIFVHGFNTKFGSNLLIAAEFWHFMTRDGVMMSFDWPSEGSVFSYQDDKANAEFAERQFRELLRFLAEHTSVEQINIIAHSAGNPVAAEALRQLSLMYYGLDTEEAQRRSKIGRVVLAAPDMDLGAAISAGLDGSGRITRGLAIYASRRDRALSLSGNIFGDVRVGRSIGKLDEEQVQALIDNDGQWIDVTNAQRHHSSFLGHSYFHQNPWVSSDILVYLRTGATAEERGLVRDFETGFLVFPDDYLEKLPDTVQQLVEKYEIRLD